MSVVCNGIQSCQRTVTITNNVSNKSVLSSEWQSTTGAYAVCSYNYTNQLSWNRTYYFHCKVKASASRDWIRMYVWGGNWSTGASVSSVVADTEYSLSTIFSPINYVGDCQYSSVYSGKGSTVSGVTNYWKDLCIYDITELLPFIDMEISRGVASSRLAWCDSKLRFTSTSYNAILYDPTDVASPFIPSDSTSMFIELSDSMSSTGGDVSDVLPSGGSAYVRTAKVYPLQLARDSVTINSYPSTNDYAIADGGGTLTTSGDVTTFVVTSISSLHQLGLSKRSTIPTNYYKPSVDDVFVYSVDLRLNSGSVSSIRATHRVYTSTTSPFTDNAKERSITLTSKFIRYNFVITISNLQDNGVSWGALINFASSDVFSVSLRNRSFYKLNLNTDADDSFLDILSNAGYSTDDDIQSWCDYLPFISYSTPLVLGKGQSITNTMGQTRSSYTIGNDYGAPSFDSSVSDGMITSNEVTGTTKQGFNIYHIFNSMVPANDIGYASIKAKFKDTNNLTSSSNSNIGIQGCADGTWDSVYSRTYSPDSFTKISVIKKNNFKSSSMYTIFGFSGLKASGTDVNTYVGYFTEWYTIRLVESGLYSFLMLLGQSTDAYIKSFIDTYIHFFTGTQTLQSILDVPMSGNSLIDKSHPTVSDGFVSGCNVVDVDGLSNVNVCGNCGGYLHADPYFDTSSNNLETYNNKGNRTVTVVREEAQSDSPFLANHKYGLTVTTNGIAVPSAGGVVGTWNSYANAVFFQIIVAKIPVGYTIIDASNPQGTGAVTKWLTSQAGTGQFTEYKFITYCGSTGSFSTGGHLYLNGTDNTSVTWYISALFTLNITGHPEYRAISSLAGRMNFLDSTMLISGGMNTSGNLIVNGDGSLRDGRNLVNLTTSYDDYPPNDVYGVKGCLVGSSGQPSFSEWIPVDFSKRYRISMWAKKNVATTNNYLPAILFKTSDGTILNHTLCMYKSGTKTYLTQAVANGDKVIHVNSLSNWFVDAATYRNRVGFRSAWNKSYNNLGTTGKFTSIDTTANTITLNSAWNGDTIPKNVTVVQSRDGGVFYYPFSSIAQASSTIDWTYKENVFYGTTDGATSSEWMNTHMFPTDTRYMYVQLNIYDSTSDFKVADARLEIINDDGGVDDILHLV